MRTLKVTATVSLFASILFVPHLVAAYEGRDRIYPGVRCQLRGDALRGEGDFVKTYTTGRNRHVTDPLPMWHFLGVSEFGSISNKSAMKDMPVICPIESSALSNSNGIRVNVKFSTVVRSIRQDDLANEFRCALTNVNDQANGALRSVISSTLDLKDVSPGEENTLTLTLPDSNSEPPNTPDVGGYVLACWLPRVREDAHGAGKFETTLIHYAVGMVD